MKSLRIRPAVTAVPFFILAMAVSAMLFWAPDAFTAQVDRPTAPAVVSVITGDNPGELYVSRDAHSYGATDHRVKWAPIYGEFKKVTNTDWNAFPVDNELTISGL